MAIDLKKFVNININYNVSTSSSADRDTAILFINDGTTKTSNPLTSLEEVTNAFSSDYRFRKGGELYYYAYSFFANGGRKLIIKSISKNSNPTGKLITDVNVKFKTGEQTTQYIDAQVSTLATPQNCNGGEPLLEYDASSPTPVETADTSFVDGKTYYRTADTVANPANCGLYEKIYEYDALTSNDLVPEIKALETKYIAIASNATYTTMFTVAQMINSGEKFDIYSKMILSCISSEKVTDISTITKASIANRGFVLKYGIPGVEMAIAAYLTQIDPNQYNIVEDYYFTTENVVYENGSTSIGYICEDNTKAEILMGLHINFNSNLVDSIRNIGGDTTNEKDLVNEFMLIILHQTLTDRLVQLLSQKIRYNQTGLSLIGATIADELQRYVRNGFLTTNKVWTDPDLVQDGITIISQNTALPLGYKYVIMPFSTLSSEDRQNHKLPSIYVLIADSYAIREINITGELF